MRYQNTSHQSLKAAIILSCLALVSGFILNGASITFTSNEPKYKKPQSVKANHNTSEMPLDKQRATSSAPLPTSYFAYVPSNGLQPTPDHEEQLYVP